MAQGPDTLPLRARLAGHTNWVTCIAASTDSRNPNVLVSGSRG